MSMTTLSQEGFTAIRRFAQCQPRQAAAAATKSPEEERRNSRFLNKADLGDWYAEEANKRKRFLNKADLADWWMRKAMDMKRNSSFEAF